MEHAIWLVIGAFLFIGLVVGGFWVIARSKLPQPVLWGFGAIVLIVIIFALVYLARNAGAGSWRLQADTVFAMLRL